MLDQRAGVAHQRVDRRGVLGVLLALAAALLGCGPAAAGGGAPDAEPKVRIVTTTAMLADAARRVGGELVEVESLMGEGVDPHLYRPTQSDVQRLMQADLVFFNGFMLEGKMQETLDRLGKAGRKVFAVAELATVSRALPAAEGGNARDPHVWMSPPMWTAVMRMIELRLTREYPQHADAFRANADAYAKEISDLHVYGLKAMKTIPETARVLITAHDAFAYFGRDYGLRLESIQGISTESEAGVRDIERLVALIVEQGVRAVFVETTVPDRNMRAVIAGVEARGGKVELGGSLFSDAMGPAGTYEGTWLGMLDHNITTVVRGLGGEAPERGLRGKLGGGESR